MPSSSRQARRPPARSARARRSRSSRAGADGLARCFDHRFRHVRARNHCAKQNRPGFMRREDLDLERRDFQSLVGRALDHLRVLEENRALRAEAARAPTVASSGAFESVPEVRDTKLPVLRFPRLLRRFGSTEILCTTWSKIWPTPPGRRELACSHVAARVRAIGCAPACVVCRRPTIWNTANAIRSSVGSSCTRTSSAARISRRPEIMRSESCSGARSILSVRK